jgi:two-component system LytT family sensor kinase
MDQRLILITLLVKLGVAAAIASALVRSKIFKSMLFREERTKAETLYLVLFAGFPFALGVMVRGSVHNFLAADLAFEATVLIGVIGGRFAGILAGALMSLPSALHGEILNLPFNVFSGLAAGILRQLTSDYDAVWSFSPFIDLSIYRWIRRNLKRPQIDWQISFFIVIVVLSFLRIHLGRAFPQLFFSLDSNQWAVYVAIYATNAMCIAIPLKIFHNARIEMKLEDQARMLLEARMEALQSQINPHFLFNTLNTVSSLVRFDPDGARELIVKLANILRRLMRKGDIHFVPLREEIDFIDDYLDIEVVRFGRDKLRVIKELDPDSLEALVPSMVLQPLVENSIKHGLSPKVGGGSIHLRSRMTDAALWIEVEDDGVGMAAASAREPSPIFGGVGIGMTNVIERLNVLYGNAAFLRIQSPDAGGTIITLRIPILESVEGQSARHLASST